MTIKCSTMQLRSHTASLEDVSAVGWQVVKIDLVKSEDTKKQVQNDVKGNWLEKAHSSSCSKI